MHVQIGRLRHAVVAGLAMVAVMFPAGLSATTISFALSADGAQEVPRAGDADGSASGVFTLDDVTGTISWRLNYSNIAEPTAMHIRGPGGGAGASARIFIDLGIVTSGGPGTLVDSLSVAPADVAAILSDPGDFYVNIHNLDFPPGAVRGQLGEAVPKPLSLAMLSLGLAVLGVASLATRAGRRRYGSAGRES